LKIEKKLRDMEKQLSEIEGKFRFLFFYKKL